MSVKQVSWFRRNDMKQEKIKKYTWSMFLSLIVCMTFVFSGCGNKKEIGRAHV